MVFGILFEYLISQVFNPYSQYFLKYSILQQRNYYFNFFSVFFFFFGITVMSKLLKASCIDEFEFTSIS